MKTCLPLALQRQKPVRENSTHAPRSGHHATRSRDLDKKRVHQTPKQPSSIPIRHFNARMLCRVRQNRCVAEIVVAAAPLQVPFLRTCAPRFEELLCPIVRPPRSTTSLNNTLWKWRNSTRLLRYSWDS